MGHIDTSQFYGTERYHRVSLLPYVLTDGVKYIADTAGAYWLMDAIGSHLVSNPDIAQAQFCVATLIVDPDRSAVLSIDDGDGNVLAEQAVGYTDYPEDRRQFYAVYQPTGEGYSWVIMLPTEY